VLPLVRCRLSPRAPAEAVRSSRRGDRIFIFTLPVAATFPIVEGLFSRFVADHPASQWLYGNVYADDGVTPIGWWEDGSIG
jgi:hypothetical protein